MTADTGETHINIRKTEHAGKRKTGWAKLNAANCTFDCSSG